MTYLPLVAQLNGRQLSTVATICPNDRNVSGSGHFKTAQVLPRDEITSISQSCIWTCLHHSPCVADMDKHAIEDVRAHFTVIGCIMEDASLVALVWDDTSTESVKIRYQQLKKAHRKIDTALQSIKATIDGG